MADASVPPQGPDRFRSAEYRAWAHMLDRCRNPNAIRFMDWGGRGITVCERWHRFDDFFADMGPRPSVKHSLDRIDNDGNYEPGNVRWATVYEQQANMRSNLRLTAFGETLIFAEWARRVGIPSGALYNRVMLYGWTPERALTDRIRPDIQWSAFGKTRYISEWAKAVGINTATLRSRVVDQGWPIERALTTPVRHKSA